MRLLAQLGSSLLGLGYDQGPGLAAQTIFPRHYHRHTLILKIIRVFHIHFQDRLAVSLPLP